MGIIKPFSFHTMLCWYELGFLEGTDIHSEMQFFFVLSVSVFSSPEPKAQCELL